MIRYNLRIFVIFFFFFNYSDAEQKIKSKNGNEKNIVYIISTSFFGIHR